MAQYKVPQDVEAEDKLIGPFSFRQFIYLGVAALGIVVAVGLWQIFPGLIIIPMPFILLFLVLALPLRKDQPMETYLTAVIRFFLKPRRRLWQPEGSIGLVTIVAPRIPQVQLTKSIGGSAAAEQLGYLAQVIDTQGWATRGVVAPNISISDDTYAEAQQAEDVLDENARVSQTFDSMIDKSTDTHKQSVIQQFRQAVRQPVDPPQSTPAANASVAQPVDTSYVAPAAQPATSSSSHGISEDDAVEFNYNPYPSSMHQHVLNPIGHATALPPVQSPVSYPTIQKENKDVQPPSGEVVSPDIMRLANNNDLSISALANEAHRIEAKDSEEVVINLH